MHNANLCKISKESVLNLEQVEKRTKNKKEMAKLTLKKRMVEEGFSEQRRLKTTSM